jgi:hypothetical protein
MAGADQHVLSGAKIILQMREAAALPPTSVLHNGLGQPAALPLPPVEEDLDLWDVFELARQCLPQLFLVPRYDNQAAHCIFRRWRAHRVGLIRHAHFLRTAELSQRRVRDGAF